MNRWRTLIFLLFISNVLPVSAQKDFLYYDSLTYRSYVEEDWESLIATSNDALTKGIDYYYLRMRVGIAHFAKQQYYEALKHFKIANEFYSNNTVLEYIYLSYLHLGYRREALYVSKKMSPDYLKEKKIQTPKLIDFLQLEVSVSQYSNWDLIKKENTPPSRPNNYILVKEISGPFRSFSLDVNHNLSKAISWYHGFSLYKISGYQQLYFDQAIKHEHNYSLYEKQYYSAITYWKNNSSTSLIVHLTRLQADKYEYTNSETTLNPLQPFTYNFIIEPQVFSKTNYYLGILRTKWFDGSSFQYSAAMAQIIDNNSLIGGILYQYSTGKFFYGHTGIQTAYNLSESDLSGYFEQQLGSNIGKNLSFNITAVYGKINNLTNIDGSLIYNAPYIIRKKWIGSLQIFFPPHLTIYGYYTIQSSDYINRFYSFKGLNHNDEIVFDVHKKSYNFVNQIFSGGVVWKF